MNSLVVIRRKRRIETLIEWGEDALAKANYLLTMKDADGTVRPTRVQRSEIQRNYATLCFSSALDDVTSLMREEGLT
ncbi:MAG: hypothetical protein PVSMB8_00230 [Vulcanimicrobiaceae bacterium]